MNCLSHQSEILFCFVFFERKDCFGSDRKVIHLLYCEQGSATQLVGPCYLKVIVTILKNEGISDSNQTKGGSRGVPDHKLRNRWRNREGNRNGISS